MAIGKQAKTGDRVKETVAEQENPCPECGKPTRIVMRIKDREAGVSGGMYRSCSVCDFADKL